MLLDFTNPVLDPRITFSRGTNATLVDSTGKITYAPSNVMLRSQEFDDIATWPTVIAGLGVAPVRTANFATAPDGTQTADRLQFNLGGGTAGADQSRIQQGNMPVISGQTYIASIYVKLNTGSSAVISLQHSGAATTSFTVTDQWQRISLSGAVAVTLANFFIGLRGGQFPANSNTIDLLVWGGQLEPVTYQTTPGTYNATTASAYYGPRFDYDPITLAPRGLLIEEARTNLLTYSEQFDNAIWGKSNATVAANVTASPDGTTNADAITEDSATSTHGVSQISGSTATGAFSFSVFVKANGRSGVNLFLRDGGGGSIAEAFFNLSAATATVSGMILQTGWSAASAAIQVLANGWYRCVISATADGTLTQAKTGFIRLNNGTGSNPNYAGNGTSGIFAYGAQLEAGAFATSYIPTVASTVTRNADIATMTGTNFSTWFNAAAGTFIADFDVGGVDTSTRRKVWNGSDAGNQRLALRAFDVTINYPIAAIGTGSTVISLNGTALAANTVTRIAVAYGANSALSQNGASPATDATANSVLVTSLGIGHDQVAIGQYLNGHIRAIAYYNTRLPNTQLQTLTAPSLAAPLALDFISPTYTVGY
jgi:hypothetical protein